MASAVDKQPAAARPLAVAAAGCLPTATRGSQSSYTTLWDTTVWPGAYDADGDSFPTMDANSNRAPWVRVRSGDPVRVKSGDPVRAMRTFDTVANRLYLPVSEAGSETDGSGRCGRRRRAAPGDADRPSIRGAACPERSRGAAAQIL